ncbi:META domain-containing protein [Octadecabacter sp. R77987]|uniref:META domain-containing protein n=1 Tax=Octadecabacter sp. R77987 TaxID=3093874 RepID=UPI00366FE2E6
MRLLPLVLITTLAGCWGDETISGYADPDREYRLIELDGTAFDARATIQFSEEGRVTGQAPCNRYFAAQTVPYPWFNVENIGATRMACPDLDTEARFFAALEEMSLAEVLGDTLILRNDAGREMVFKSDG